MSRARGWLDAAPALVAAALFAALFAALAASRGSPWPMAAIDARVHAALQPLRTPALDALARGATFLGDPVLLGGAGAIGAALLLFAGRTREAFALGFCLAAVALGVGELKLLFARARPLAPATLASFPSGHAALAALFYPAIARIAAAGARGAWRVAAAALAAPIPIGVGATRIWLGAHWTSDVLAGFALGCAGFAVFLALLAAGSGPRGNRLRRVP